MAGGKVAAGRAVVDKVEAGRVVAGKVLAVHKMQEGHGGRRRRVDHRLAGAGRSRAGRGGRGEFGAPESCGGDSWPTQEPTP